jgi:4-amino-4-deoxy-L-arabinose transferase-like glycosyltransferase
MNKFITILCFILLFSIYFLLEIGSASHESLTFDELVYISEGKANVVHKQFLVDPYNPPFIRELTTIPLLFHSPNPGIPSNQAYFPSRFVVILLGASLLLAVFIFCLLFFDELTAFLSVALLVFDPTFLANSHYITPDVGATLFLFLSWFSYRLFIKRPTTARLLTFSILSGLTCASKIPTAVFLMVAVLSSYFFEVELRKAWKRRFVFLYILVLLLTIWGTFWFSWKPILAQNNNPNRVAERVIAYTQRHNIPWAGSLITALYTIPVPMGDYLALIKNTVIRSQEVRSDFILGAKAKPNFVTPFSLVLFKTPIPIVLLLLLSLIIRRQRKIQNVFKIVYIPILCIVGIVAISKMSPLIRYLLPMLPFLFIFICSQIRHSKNASILTGIAVLFVWYVVGTITTYPYFITYANELLSSEKQKVVLLEDSNVDWGQGLPALSTYVSTVKPKTLLFSYFGRDDASRYGFVSDIPWGSYKNNEICLLHTISYPKNTQESLVAISVTNWHSCGYDQLSEFGKDKIKTIVGGSILIFPDTPEENK